MRWKNITITEGSLSAWYDRLGRMLNVPSRIAVIAVYFKILGGSWWYLLLIPVLIVIMIWDIKRAMPSQQDYMFSRSEKFNQLCRNVDEIKRKMK